MRGRTKCILIEIATEYIQIIPASKVARSGKGGAAISSQISNVERAGEQGGKWDPEGGGDERL